MRSYHWDQIWARRLARSRLLEPAPAGDLVVTVSALAGVHAQVPASAEVALGLRVADITRVEVRAAQWEQRSLVRAHGRRGTLHLVPSGELGLWVAAFAGRAEADAERACGQMGLDRVRFDAMVAAVPNALGDRVLDRADLGAAITRLVGPWAAAETFPAFGQRWPRWRVAIQHATALGLAVHGPNRGNHTTYVATESWLGPIERVEPDRAAREVALRFLRTYGPATAEDLARWLAVGTAEARRTLAGLAGELTEVDVEGWAAVELAGEIEPPPVHGVVRLLPLFDDYVIGCHPRRQLVRPEWADRVFPGGSAGNVAVLLVDGTIAGRWHRAQAGRRVRITVEPFRRLGRAERTAVEEQADRVARITEGRAELTFDTVAAAPHL